MPRRPPPVAFAALAALTFAAPIAGCDFIRSLRGPTKKVNPEAEKPVVIRSFSETSAVTAVQPAAGAIWVGTGSGLQKWDVAKGTMVRATVANGLPADKIAALAGDGRGGVWVMTAAGLAHEDKRGGWVKLPPAPVGALVSGLVQTDDGLYAGGPEGLAKVQKGGWVRLLGDTAVTAMASGGKDLWVGTAGKGVVHVVGEQVQVYTSEQGCETETVRGLTATPSGVMAIGEGPGGQRMSFFDGTRFWSYRIETPGKMGFEWIRRVGDHALIGSGTQMFDVQRLGAGDNAPASTVKMIAVDARALKPAPTGSARRDLPTGPIADPTAAASAPPSRPADAKSADARAAQKPGDAKAATSTTAAPSPPAAAIAEDPAPAWTVGKWGPALPEGVTTIGSDGALFVVGTRSLGAVKVEETALTSYQTFDLAKDAERITVACQSETDCFVATGTTRAWHFDGQSFGPASIDPEAGSRVLAVVTPPRGSPVAIHNGPNDRFLRVSSVSSEGTWSPTGMTQLEVPAGVPTVTFAGFAPTGRLWLGLRYVDKDGDKVDFGAAEVDLDRSNVVYHRKGGGLGAQSKPLPNDIENAWFAGADDAWFGTRAGAVHLKAGELGTFTESDGLASESIHDIIEGNDGQIWVATSKGVGKFDGARWTFPSEGDALHVKASSLARDRLGAVFVGHSAGLVMVRPDRVEKIDSSRGLLDNQVIDLAVDKRGRVWVLTEKGISIIDRQ